jgi:hypothetical protein
MALSTCLPTNACVENIGGGTFGFHPVTSPLSLSKMNGAGPPLPLPSVTTNPNVGLNTCPVGPLPGMFTVRGRLANGPGAPAAP